MTAEKSPYIHFAPGERNVIRYTVVSLSTLALVGTIVFSIWVLGQIIAALHALIFPLAIAGVLALVLFPVIAVFQRYLRMNRIAAVISLFIILFSLFLLFLALVVPTAVNQGAQFVQSIPDMAERAYEALSGQFPETLPMLEDALTEMEIEAILPDAEDAADRAKAYIGFVVGLGFVPLYLFFALLSGDHMKEYAQRMLFLFTKKRQNDVLYLGQLFVDYVTAFFRGQLTIALIMGVMMAVGFTIVGLKAGIFFGLALGLLNIVPYLGFLVGVITVLPIAYLQPEGGGQLVLLVLGVIAFTQLVESMFLTPKIMANRSGLHPVVVVISILFWGTVLGGVIGMILAVPLTAFLFTLGQHLKSRLCSEADAEEADQPEAINATGDNDRHTPDGAY